MGFGTEIRGRLSTGSHDSPVVRGNVNKAATEALPEDLLTRIYELCIDGYKLLLSGTLGTNEIRSSLDNEYVRLQLWGIDTGILKGKLGVLRAHPLYQTAGFILQKILRRLLRLGGAYLTDDAAQATWLQRASDYTLEMPSFFATRGEEDTSGKPPEDKDHSLTAERFWAEREEQKAPRDQATAHNVTMEVCSKQDQALEGCEETGSGIELEAGSPIYPSDSASQSGIHESQVAEGTSISKLEMGKPSSTVLSSGNGSSSSSVSSIVVPKVIEALTAFNNCLFSIVKEMDMAMADYGKGSLSELYAAVKVKVDETATAGKAPSIMAEDSTDPEESNIKTTRGIGKGSMEPSSPPNPTYTVKHSQATNCGQVHSTPSNPGQRDVNTPEPAWHPLKITTSPNFRLPPPPPSVSETLQSPQPIPQKSESKQALPPKVSDKTNQSAPEKRQQYTQDSTVAPTSPPRQPPSEQPNIETFFSREKIVAAAMTNDKSLFDLMHTYADMGQDMGHDMGHDTTDVGFGLFCEKYQEVVSVPLKQPWLSLDLAMCMWKNASRVIRDKFKELAKNKLQDLKRVDDDINHRAGLEPAAAVCTAYPLPVLSKELSYQRAIESSARPRKSTPAPVYGETGLVYIGAEGRRYPWPKTGDNSRDRRSSPPPPNMANLVYEITAPTSPNGSPTRGGGVRSTYARGDDGGKNYYDDRSHPSVGRSNSIYEQHRAASVHVGDSRDRGDGSRHQSTSHGGGSRRPARSNRSSRSRASTYGRHYHSSSSDSSDEYGYYTPRSRSRKRSSSGPNESLVYREYNYGDYDDYDYDFLHPHVQKQHSNNSTDRKSVV